MTIFPLEGVVATPWRLADLNPPIAEKVADADRETDKKDDHDPHGE